MSFSQVKIDLAKHGKDTKILIDGEEPLKPFDVKIHANVGRATKMTLYRPNAVAVTSYLTGTVEGEADYRRTILCPKCREEQHGNRMMLNPLLKWRKRLKGMWRAIRLMFAWRYKAKAASECTEMGDENRRYIA